MFYEISLADVWVGEIDDRPGGLAKVLESMRDAGANLEFIMARRAPEDPGKGVLFAAPLRTAVAHAAGMTRSSSMHCVRLEGPDQPGLGANIAGAMAEHQINMRGLSGNRVGDRFMIYVAFDSAAEAQQATQVLNQVVGLAAPGAAATIDEPLEPEA
jgi:hypothetical protein